MTTRKNKEKQKKQNGVLEKLFSNFKNINTLTHTVFPHGADIIVC